MVTAIGAGCDPGRTFGDPPLDGPVLTIAAGDAIRLPITWWQVRPVYQVDGNGNVVRGSDGNPIVVTPGVPVDMTGMAPSGEFLTYGQQPWTGTPLTVSSFVATAGSFLLTGPGRGQQGDLTSGLPAPSPARISGPRVRVSYADPAGSHTFGTYYLAVK